MVAIDVDNVFDACDLIALYTLQCVIKHILSLLMWYIPTGDSTSSVLALLHQLHSDQWSELLSLLTTAEGELPRVVVDYISLLPLLPLSMYMDHMSVM